MGLSRDDYTKFSKEYENLKIFKADPFAAIDQEGVGKLIEMAIKLGRKTRPDLEIGICGEHGGEPQLGRILLPRGHELRIVLALPRARSRGWRRRRRRSPATSRKPCARRRYNGPQVNADKTFCVYLRASAANKVF